MMKVLRADGSCGSYRLAVFRAANASNSKTTHIESIMDKPKFRCQLSVEWGISRLESVGVADSLQWVVKRA